MWDWVKTNYKKAAAMAGALLGVACPLAGDYVAPCRLVAELVKWVAQ